jgi:hypothetical protein
VVLRGLTLAGPRMRAGIAPSKPAYLGFTKESMICPAFLHSPIFNVSDSLSVSWTGTPEVNALAREAGNGL